MKVKNIIYNDYLFNIISKLLLVICGLFTSAFLARYLGVEVRGDYSYVIEIVTIVALIADLGFDQSYSYFFKSTSGNIYSDFLNIISLHFFALILIALSIATLFHTNHTLLLVCSMVPLEVLNRQFAGIMATENIRRKIVTDTLASIVKAVLFILLFTFRSLVGVKLSYCIYIICAIYIITCSSYIISKKRVPRPDKVTLSQIKKVVSYSWLPMLSVLMLTLNYSLDIIFMKQLGTQTELGLYAIAVGIVNYIWLVPDAIKEVLISRVVRSDDVSHTIKGLQFAIASVIVVIVLFIILGRVAIIILYGRAYLPSYGVTIILSIGAVSMTVFKVLNVTFLAEGKRVFYFISLLISVVMNIIMNCIMIPRMGMYGAAISSIISYTLCGLAFFEGFKRTKGLQMIDFFKKY